MPQEPSFNVPWVLGKGFVLLFVLLNLADLGFCNCRLDFAIKQSPVKLTLSRPLEAFSESLNIPEEVRWRIEMSGQRQSLQYRGFLTYTPTDGFSNQLISLSTAMQFAWLTNRVLVVPPLLGHYEGPARGNCRKPSRGLKSQDDIKAGRYLGRVVLFPLSSGFSFPSFLKLHKLQTSFFLFFFASPFLAGGPFFFYL